MSATSGWTRSSKCSASRSFHDDQSDIRDTRFSLHYTKKKHVETIGVAVARSLLLHVMDVRPSCTNLAYSCEDSSRNGTADANLFEKGEKPEQ
jgi:hypothetical protein